MKRLTLTLITAVAVAALAVPVSAQQNEVGIFVSLAQFDSETFVDPEFGDTFTLDFEGQLGWGASYNRYFGEQFSIDFAVQQINSDAEVNFEDLDVTFDFGSVDVTAYSAIAQWHFGGTSATIAPYLGAGVALVSGQAELDDDLIDPDDPETEFDFESETTWVANAGIDFRLGTGFAIFADAKYIPYDALEENSPDDEAVSLNPLVFAAGVKFRF
ncbi:MAG TPA: OmpW family outer membrane protein [Thermoanaerobaculia bacterium]|nr:OmpW family outer membrane protein [Thermoanaerobaculia bacterium]